MFNSFWHPFLWESEKSRGEKIVWAIFCVLTSPIWLPIHLANFLWALIFWPIIEEWPWPLDKLIGLIRRIRERRRPLGPPDLGRLSRRRRTLRGWLRSAWSWLYLQWRQGRPMTRRERLSRDHYQWQVHAGWRGEPTDPEDWDKVRPVYLSETTWPKQLWRWIRYVFTSWPYLVLIGTLALVVGGYGVFVKK